MRNMAIESFCDQAIVYSLFASIFILPASIAFLNSFVILAIFFYLVKKIHRIIADWPVKTLPLNVLGKLQYIFNGFAPPENFLNSPLKLLVAAFFISTVFSHYPALSFAAFIGKFIKCVFMYFSFIEAFRDEKQIRIFLVFFLASAFITALSGAFQHFTGRDFLKGHLIGNENYVSTERINSLFFTANGFGAFLLPSLGLAVHLVYAAITRHRSWFLGGVLVLLLTLLLACLCWTYSRSSWIGFLAILIVTVILDWRKVIFVVTLSLMFVSLFLPSLNNVRHQGLINDNNGHVQQLDSVHSMLEQGGSGRLAYWKKAVSIIRSSPLLGTGLNTYTRIIKKDINPSEWWYAHNCYLQMAAETGLIGLACFLWMLIVLVWHGFRCCYQLKDPWTLTFLQGSIAGLCGFLVQSFFDNTFYTVQLGMLMWLIIGMIVSLTRLRV